MLRVRRLTALAGILVLLLAACGPAATPTPTAPPQPTATPATVPPGQTTPTPTRVSPTATPLPGPTPSVRTGGKLKPNALSGPVTLDPHAITSGTTEVNQIFDSLVRMDAQQRFMPGLAESWDAPDPTTLVLKLRKGVKFHDGSPFNAQVAKWNFDRIFNPETVSPTARISLAPVDTVEVLDDYTLRLKLKRPASDLVYHLATGIISMMTPTAVAKWGKEVGAHPVGTGAFIFQDWLPDRSLKVKRNPQYWDQPLPYVDEIESIFTVDPSVIMASLLTGLMDLARISEPEHVEKLEKTTGFTVQSIPGQATWGLYFNHLKAPMNNPDFRKALDLALDREGMVKGLLLGRGGPATSILSPAFAEHNANLPVTKRDVARAKELLARSGYKGEGIDFGCWPSIAIGPKICEAMQAQFKEIGLNAQITMHAAAAYAAVLGQLKYDISVLYTPLMPLEQRVTAMYDRQGRLNSGRFGDSPVARKLEELIVQISMTYDFDTRKRLFDELQKVHFDNVMDLYAMYYPESWGVRARVQNFQARPGTGMWYHDVWLKE
ncbi:MAG: ABC transporter substrate-binding protein [Chloroflexi bacterium]|nr:ABC transporter substrate-binding protein [Chloroflexota bacterium]